MDHDHDSGDCHKPNLAHSCGFKPNAPFFNRLVKGLLKRTDKVEAAAEPGP